MVPSEPILFRKTPAFVISMKAERDIVIGSYISARKCIFRLRI